MISSESRDEFFLGIVFKEKSHVLCYSVYSGESQMFNASAITLQLKVCKL